MSAVNFIFDPLHILKLPAEKALYDRQTRYALPGLLRQNKTEVAIVGTSVVQDFDESYFEENWKKNITRYPVLGGTGYEQRRALETLLGGDNPPETVIWGLDVASFSGDLNRIRWAQFPEHLFSNDWNVYPRYIFSFETFYRLLRLIPDYMKAKSQEERFVFKADNLEFSKNAVLRAYCGDGLQARLDNLESFDFTTQDVQIQANIVAPIGATPNTQFIVFFPPYSAVQYAEFDRVGALPALLSFRAGVLNALKEFDNVTVYDFQSARDIVENLDNYRDPFHYGRNVMHIMSDAWKNGDHILTSENLAERQQIIQDLAAQYSTVWGEVHEVCGI